MTIFYAFIKKYRKRIVSVLLIATVVQTIMQIEYVCADETLSMYSGSYALIDGETGRVLRGKKEEEPMANASTTKILTCIVTLENCSLDELVTVSSNAVSQPKVRLGMQEGAQYSLEELLYGLMLESYNDCAVAIAEHVAGSTEAFAKLLNQKAKEIGCKDTYFITPNGLDATDENGFHHTTAADLCRMMAYCTWESEKSEMFLKITQTRNYGEFVNRNTFLNQMEGLLSGKTGFTNKAGYCYVAAMEINGERYCIALLACGWPNNKSYRWTDARNLFEYGMENYSKHTVMIEAIERKLLIDGYVGKPDLKELNCSNQVRISSDKKEYSVLLSKEDKIEKEIILYTDISPPIKEGQIMGVCNVYLNNIIWCSFPIEAKENAYIWGMKDVFYTIFYQFLTFSL